MTGGADGGVIHMHGELWQLQFFGFWWSSGVSIAYDGTASGAGAAGGKP